MGVDCGFAHGEHELVHSGIPGKPLGIFIPGKFKTELCRHFEKGTCAMGVHCAFAHGLHELKKPGENSGLADGGEDTLDEFMAGIDKELGKKKLKKKVKPINIGADEATKNAYSAGIADYAKPGTAIKTALCRHFMKGACAMGLKCGFAHGEHELGMLPGVTEKALALLGGENSGLLVDPGLSGMLGAPAPSVVPGSSSAPPALPASPHTGFSPRLEEIPDFLPPPPPFN